MTSTGGTSGAEGTLLYRGAEADILKGSWQGMPAVYKVRKPLAYRLPQLDAAIRRQRTIHEAEMIHDAKRAGVRTPYLYDVDVPGSTMVMEHVEGPRLKDSLGSGTSDDARGLFREFGRAAARLHDAGIVHGDLTTANAVAGQRDLVLIDFGLSYRTTRLEDQAVDFRLIKETLVGAHPAISRWALEELFVGYSEVVGPAKLRAVQRQLRSIERRGRYARVE
ncbi:MAG: Kae1-associated serine/threonine protein kinase [Nitrososphaerota archaeon]|nr:Kae1-associated serine/threonine protein kinase [Nitrososphaerota archaeon]